MPAGESASCHSAQRGKGRPAVIDRDKIVAAARRIPADRLTMQAVANELGVDPTALNYHVGGREGLMRLAAADRLKMALDDEELAQVRGQWPDVLRAFARMTRSAVASVGVLAKHVDLGASGVVPFLKVIDVAIRALKEAGFSDQDAGRIIGMISHQAVIAGKARSGCDMRTVDPAPCSFTELAGDCDNELPHVSALMAYHLEVAKAGRPEWEADEQFEFGLDVTLRGLQSRLTQDVP